jgi:hypothetical protein
MKNVDLDYLRRKYKESKDDAAPFFKEGRDISDFIFPKHGRFDRHPNETKKVFSSSKIVNPVATDAFNVLTSGMHGRLTGQNRPWCKLVFADGGGPANAALNMWLYECQKRLHAAWNKSNFYEVMPIFYRECAGFGTAAMHISDSEDRVFTFDLFTFGEFTFTLSPDNTLDLFFYYVDLTDRQLEEEYGRPALPEAIQDRLSNKAETNFKSRVIRCIYKAKNGKRRYTSVHFLEAHKVFDEKQKEKPLRVSGYYEQSCVTARWESIGTDTYGSGLGSDVLPLVKRLQEMDKAFLVATHKAVNPPVNIPSRMKGSVSLIPGGHNYTSNPNEKVEPILNGGFEYMGVANASERVEMAIRKLCYNDVFITAVRDPNASPLKAAQVMRQEDEEVLRLGPVIGRLYSEALSVIVERCFNIMLRRGLFPPIDPELLKESGGVNVMLIGPLAQQQKLIEVRSINSFFSFIGSVTPIDPSAIDNINMDKAINEVADMTGVPAAVLATPEEIQQKRQARAAEMARQQQMEDAAAQQSLASEAASSASGTMKNFSEAGVNIAEVLGGGAGL